MKRKLAAAVIAAGYGCIDGRCKLLAPVNGHPMVHHVVETLQAVRPDQTFAVVNPRFQAEVRKVLEPFPLDYVVQPSRTGTGGATSQVLDVLPEDCEDLLITFADMPMWSTDTLQALVNRHFEADSPELTMVTIPLVAGTRPERYGRILEDADGNVLGTIEPWQIPPGTVVVADKVNPSLYVAKVAWLRSALPCLKPVDRGDGFAHEYLLQEVIHVAAETGKRVAKFEITDLEQALGVNNKEELLEVREIFERRQKLA